MHYGDVQLKSLAKDFEVTHNVLVCDQLPVSDKSIPLNVHIEGQEHLSDVNIIELPHENQKVELLIGTDLGVTLLPLKDGIRRGSLTKPSAINTIWGWSILGPDGNPKKKGSACCAFLSVDAETLNKQMNRMFLYDFNDPPGQKDGLSVDDQEALNIFDNTFSRRESGKIEMGLPWKGGREHAAKLLPTEASEKMAKNRTLKLGERLKRDPKLNNMVMEQLKHLEEKGYARRVPPEELEQPPGIPTWYLPILAIQHENKPDKVRVCQDGHAEAQKTSLNSKLLQGPDMGNSLVGILLRYRQYPVTIMADISEFFYQFYVSKQDIHALRYFC